MSKTKKSKTERLKPKEQSQIIAQHFSGPVPSPQILEQYRHLIPDAPERFMKMAEKNSDHGIDMDKGRLQATVTLRKRGQQYGLSIAALFVILCIITLILGYPYVAAIFGSVDLTGMIIAFLVDRKN